MSILRNAITTSALIPFFISCSPGSPDPVEISSADTIRYTAPAPGNLSDADRIRYRSAVQAFYDTTLVPKGFNGAILVAKNGHIIFEKYHGYSNLVKKDSLDEHSSFHLASVSKTFTAMAILGLAEKSKLSLGDDLSKYFPGFPYPGVTIHMLLSHRSGLPNYMYFMQKLGWDIRKYSFNEDVLDYMVRFKPELTSVPGTRFTYCNTNYALLALIIERVTGSTYADHLKRTIFQPLGMNDTYVFSLADTLQAMPSYDFRGRPEAFTFLDGEYGDKNIYSTPRDLLKWDQALYTNQLVSQASLDGAFTPYSNEKPGIKNYGYGWRMDNFPDGKKIIFHNGWWHGNNTSLIRLIEDSATIIILGNKRNRVIYDSKLLANIFQLYFVHDEPEALSQDDPGFSKTDSMAELSPLNKKKKILTRPVKKPST